MSEQEVAPYTITLKFGPGFEAPWLVVRADSHDDALQKIGETFEASRDAAAAGNLPLAIAQAAGQAVGTRGVVEMSSGSSKPEPAQAEPAKTSSGNGGWSRSSSSTPTRSFGSGTATDTSEAPTCEHGTRVFREGVGARGPWKAWFCPERNRDRSCKPIFLDA